MVKLISIFPLNCSKKWLPQQLRKLSHSGKTDKLPIDKAVGEKKKDKDKKSKQDKQKEELESSTSTSVASLSLTARSSAPLSNSTPHQDEEDVLECLELPPPMKPISDPSQIEDSCTQTSNPSGSKVHDESDLAEIEQIVKEKMVRKRKAPQMQNEKLKIYFLFSLERKNTKQV